MTQLISNLYFKPLLSDVSMAICEVKGMHLGKLITICSIVTWVSEVKPLLLVNAYTCDICDSEIFQEISRKEFTPIADCQNENECMRNNTKGFLHMLTYACRFSPFQEAKIQEMVFGPVPSWNLHHSLFPQVDQVPVGHIPRSMMAHVNGSLTHTVNPSNIIHLGGIFLPIPYIGFQAIRGSLLTDTYLEVHHIHQLTKQYNKMEVTAEMHAAIERLHDDPTVYQNLHLAFPQKSIVMSTSRKSCCSFWLVVLHFCYWTCPHAMTISDWRNISPMSICTASIWTLNTSHLTLPLYGKEFLLFLHHRHTNLLNKPSPWQHVHRTHPTILPHCLSTCMCAYTSNPNMICSRTTHTHIPQCGHWWLGEFRNIVWPP